ncbi:MAG TPA: uroporphyrinogen-III synthase [Gaiellaceae bacterium]|nr:uroporphyrinogen-III synthase [Gaiellaceae bacterium]
MKVIVTRPAGQEEELVQGLLALGHEVVRCPLLEVEPLGDSPLDVSGYGWVIVTSVNGARELRRRMIGTPARVAAIGQATAEAFGGADLVPAVSTQEGLLAELPRPAGRVLFAAAEGARRLLVDELDATFLPLYRTRELTPPEPPDGDIVVLASASAARAFARLDVAIPAVSIGPLTSAAARDVGIDVVREAATHDVAGLLAAVGSAACSSAS